MFCSNCGTENNDAAQFCSSCRTPLHPGAQLAPQRATVVYAGFWLRFVASIIDTIILSLGGAVIGGILGVILGIILAILGFDSTTIQVIAGIMGYCIGFILNWLYFTMLEASAKQATPGKMVLRLIVTDLDGNRISFGRANGRYWGKIISAVILMVGFIMAGFTEKKQALHDILAGTLVVKK